jgi:beta-lactamase regulating signal transducer with metallopeptidase domain
MFGFDWLGQPVSRLLTQMLLHFIWQGFFLAAALWTVVEFCGIRRATYRYACSLTALVAMTLLPLMTLAQLASSRVNAASAWSVVSESASAPPTAAVPSLTAYLEASEPYFLAAWLVGVALFGGRLMTGAVGIAWLRRGRLPLSPELIPIVERLGRRLQITATSVVFLSWQVTDAMAVGLIRPLVLIPAAWAVELPVEMLEAVIAHELAHLARRDLWVNLLQRLVETVLFYHPAVWWLSRRMRIERELCADELAVAATGKRLEYTQALEHIAAEREADIRPALAAFLRGETDMRLLERVRNVLDQPAAERSRLWPVGLAALALPLGLWLSTPYSSLATANDDDDKKPAIKRQRDERDEIKRAMTAIRDSERKDTEKLDELKNKIAAELKRSEEREGKKPVRAEEVEERIIVRREGQRPEERIEKRIVLVDGKPIFEVELDRKEEKKESSDRRFDELASMVKQLAQRLERLQDQVSELREQRGGDKPSTPRKQQLNNTERNSDIERALIARKQELERAAQQIEAAQRKLEQQKSELADQFGRRDKEALERAVRQKVEEAGEQKRRAELQAREGQEKAELKAREAREKAQAIEREKRERASDELNRAQKLTERAVREKHIEEKKQLEEKLRNLKEKKDKDGEGGES